MRCANLPGVRRNDRPRVDRTVVDVAEIAGSHAEFAGVLRSEDNAELATNRETEGSQPPATLPDAFNKWVAAGGPKG
jgi:hypothetical protein